MEHAKLSSHHVATAQRILTHPTSHNLEWRDVASLLNEIDSIIEEPNGRFMIKLGDQTEIFDRPRGKDLDTQQVIDLRRMLNAAGITLDSLNR